MLTPEHIHLVLNHVPILGTLFGLGLLAWALARRSSELTRVALGVFVIAALFTIPVYLTGQPAEHAIKGAPELSEAVIGPHENAAKIALILSLATGLVSLAVLFGFRKLDRLPQWSVLTIVALGALSSGWFAYTGNLGGQIRHTEVRADFSGFPGASSKSDGDKDAD